MKFPVKAIVLKLEQVATVPLTFVKVASGCLKYMSFMLLLLPEQN